MMSVGREFVLDVIAMYRERPCLWQVTNEDYHNKSKRNKALDEFIDLFRSVDPNANRETVSKKLASIRGAYNKELRKVQASQVSGTGAEEVHNPKLWYFKELKFLSDHVPRTTISPTSLLDKMPFTEDETETLSEESLSEGSCTAAASTPSTSRSKPTFKRSRQKVDLVLDIIAKRLDEQPRTSGQTKQLYDAFGEHIAEKMRLLPPSMVPLSQKLINEVMFLAEYGQLNLTSRVVTKVEPDVETEDA